MNHYSNKYDDWENLFKYKKILFINILTEYYFKKMLYIFQIFENLIKDLKKKKSPFFYHIYHYKETYFTYHYNYHYSFLLKKSIQKGRPYGKKIKTRTQEI